MPGRARKKNDAEQRNGLYEEDGELVEWRNGNQIGPRTNFMPLDWIMSAGIIKWQPCIAVTEKIVFRPTPTTVKPIGYCEQGTIGGSGYVMEVSVKDNGRNNKWKVIAKATDFQSARSTINALNKDGRLLAPNPSSLLPKYMDRIIRKFLSEEVKTPVQLEVKSSKQEKRKRPKEEESSQYGSPTKKKKKKKSKKTKQF